MTSLNFLFILPTGKTKPDLEALVFPEPIDAFALPIFDMVALGITGFEATFFLDGIL